MTDLEGVFSNETPTEQASSVKYKGLFGTTHGVSAQRNTHSLVKIVDSLADGVPFLVASPQYRLVESIGRALYHFDADPVAGRSTERT